MEAKLKPSIPLLQIELRRLVISHHHHSLYISNTRFHGQMAFSTAYLYILVRFGGLSIRPYIIPFHASLIRKTEKWGFLHLSFDIEPVLVMISHGVTSPPLEREREIYLFKKCIYLYNESALKFFDFSLFSSFLRCLVI